MKALLIPIVSILTWVETPFIFDPTRIVWWEDDHITYRFFGGKTVRMSVDEDAAVCLDAVVQANIEDNGIYVIGLRSDKEEFEHFRNTDEYDHMISWCMYKFKIERRLGRWRLTVRKETEP